MYSIRETFVFQTKIYTKYMLFLLVFAAVSISSFFSHEEHEDMPLSWQMILFRIFRFFGSEESVWSEIKNPFLDSPKKPTLSLWVNVRMRLRLLTGGLSWGTQTVFAWGVLSSPLSCPGQIEKRGDPGDKVGHFMWTYIEPLHRCRSDFDFN